MSAAASILNLLEVAPGALEDLATTARAEGYRHIDRLIVECRTGANAFRMPGCGLIGASMRADEGARIVAVGGVTPDPSDAGLLRMRRFYVHPECRRQGIGARLAGLLMLEGRSSGRGIVVHAGDDRSAVFWVRLGFHPVTNGTHTHEFSLSAREEA